MVGLPQNGVSLRIRSQRKNLDPTGGFPSTELIKGYQLPDPDLLWRSGRGLPKVEQLELAEPRGFNMVQLLAVLSGMIT